MAAFRGFQVVARFRASYIFGQTSQTCFYRAATVARAQQLNLFRQAHARKYARQAFNYQRYKASSNLFKRWAARPSFYYEVGGLGAAGGGFYFYNLEAVPVRLIRYAEARKVLTGAPQTIGLRTEAFQCRVATA